MAVHRAPQTGGRGRKLLLIVVPPLLLLAGVAVLLIVRPEEPMIALDADLCPLDEAAGPSAALLLDLRKPLGDGAASLAKEVLREVTAQLPRHTELRVFALTSNAAAPRLPVRRFCKPYGNEDIAAQSAKDVPETRDCDNLPAQLPAQTAANAAGFCALRDQVGEEIQRLVARPLAIPVPNAYLVEAIEETSLAFAEEPGRARSLYVFSDMLQHAGWFSHVELGSQGWGFNDFIHVREMEEASVGPRPPPLDDVAVTVYYTPRAGVTDGPRPKMNHMAFWRQYFTDALGKAPTFEELATLPEYPVEPLLNMLTEAEQLVQERKRLEAESKRLERATAEYEAAQERARTEAARRAAEAAAAREAEEAAARDAAEAAGEAEAAAAKEAEEEAARQAAAAQEAEQRAAQEQTVPAAPAPSAAEDAPPPPDIAAADTPPTQPPAEPAATAETDSAPAAVPQLAAEPEPPPPAPPIPAVEPADQDEPAEASNAQQAAYCTATLQERYENSNAYPIKNRRLNLGAADIAVEFVVNDQGETVDDTVRVIEESSTATRPGYFDAFADEARKVVREWVFDFDAVAATDACSRTQTVRARVKFKY